jgi:hypothetical protein|tara:strand:- start:317 stop:769 length:453 start_codon:yes stop_codon:yes gene_type:complete
MSDHNIKYEDEVTQRECDCPMPMSSQVRHPKLGRATVIDLCCLAEKVSGGTPTRDGVAVTDFIHHYEFTHVRAAVNAKGEETHPEFAVADKLWDVTAKVVVDAGSPARFDKDGNLVESAVSETTKAKGNPPAWLDKRLRAKKLDGKLPSL